MDGDAALSGGGPRRKRLCLLRAARWAGRAPVNLLFFTGRAANNRNQSLVFVSQRKGAVQSRSIDNSIVIINGAIPSTGPAAVDPRAGPLIISLLLSMARPRGGAAQPRMRQVKNPASPPPAYRSRSRTGRCCSRSRCPPRRPASRDRTAATPGTAG
jgi:hypothetical protein